MNHWVTVKFKFISFSLPLGDPQIEILWFFILKRHWNIIYLYSSYLSSFLYQFIRFTLYCCVIYPRYSCVQLRIYRFVSQNLSQLALDSSVPLHSWHFERKKLDWDKDCALTSPPDVLSWRGHWLSQWVWSWTYAVSFHLISKGEIKSWEYFCLC